MNNQALLDEAEKLLKPFSIRIDTPANQSNRIDFYIKPDDIKSAVRTLYEAQWGYLITISAYDSIDESGTPIIGLVYHFANESVLVSIRFSIPHTNRTIDTICDIIPSATLYERECMELFGIEIKGTPNKDKLILPDDWPDGVYPLWKSFKGLTSDGKWSTEAKESK